MPCVQRPHSPCTLPGGGRGRGQCIHSNASEPAKHMNGRPSSWSGTWDEDRGHPIWLVKCQYSEDLRMHPLTASGRAGQGGGIAGVRLKTGGNIIKIRDKHKARSDLMLPWGRCSEPLSVPVCSLGDFLPMSRWTTESGPRSYGSQACLKTPGRAPASKPMPASPLTLRSSSSGLGTLRASPAVFGFLPFWGLKGVSGPSWS